MMLLNDVRVIQECATIALAGIARDLKVDYTDVFFRFEFVDGRLIPEISARNTDAWTDDQVRAVFKKRSTDFKALAAARLEGNRQRRMVRGEEESTGSSAADAVIRAARAARFADPAPVSPPASTVGNDGVGSDLCPPSSVEAPS